MANSEIKVSMFELAESNGNLKTLSANWSALPTVSASCISESKGRAAERIIDISNITQQVSKSFSLLIDNSVGYFEALGMSFDNADATVAQNIETVLS